LTQISNTRRWARRSLWVWGLSLVAAFCACSADSAKVSGPRGGKLAPCPDRPNCVSSDADDAARRVAPFVFQGSATDAWDALGAHVATLPRVRVVSASPVYLHAVVRSRFFRFEDDLEFYLRPKAGVIAVRSASRSGYFDFGVNRRRIEAIRSHLTGLGVLRKP
jgi:uncharacterized protein (DUF1499 family)